MRLVRSASLSSGRSWSFWGRQGFRWFVLWGALSGVTTSAPWADSAPSFGALPILQGPSTATTVTVVVGFTGPNEPELRLVGADGTAVAPVQVVSKIRMASPLKLRVARFDGLRESTEYRLRVSEGGRLVDQRLLAPLQASANPIRIVVAACMDDYYDELQKKMWSQVWGERPNALFLIGDNTYADRRGGKVISPEPGFAEVVKRYGETRSALALFRQERLIPVFTTWDDHDVGRDNSHKGTPGLSLVSKLFRDYFPGDSLGSQYEQGPGISSVLKWGFLRFHFMDDRTFRTSETHWGKEQEDWLIRGLSEKGKLLHWVINGDQFWGGYAPQFESYEANHPRSLARWLERAKRTGAKLVFLSGDRHLLEFQKIEPKILGYESYEFTTSAIHAVVFPSSWGEYPNRRQIFGRANINNYAVFDFSRKGERAEVRVTGMGPSREVLKEFSFSMRLGH